MILSEAYQKRNSALTSSQEVKLRELVAYVRSCSPFYKELFSNRGIEADDIKAFSDLGKLPVTTKEDLQLRNVDFLCVPHKDIIEYASTSGTLGKPVTIYLTENDLERLAFNEYQSFLTAETSSSDVFQLMLTLDRQFMAGIAYYNGLRKLGAGVIRLGPGVPSLQWETIQRLKPNALVVVPSFLLKLIQYAREHAIDLNTCSVRKAICIGEPIRNSDFSYNALGQKIISFWNIQLFSTYASTEMQTAFTECGAGQGGHLQPELLIAELLDERDQPVAAGYEGELTITTLGVEGMPLLRYKTGDIATFSENICACGRTTLRLSPILGRKKQMIKFKGTTLYPPALFDLLAARSDVLDFVIEVSSNELGLDEVRFYILPLQFSDESDRNIRAYLQAKLRVSPYIDYITPQELQALQFPENARKPVKFIDKR